MGPLKKDPHGRGGEGEGEGGEARSVVFYEGLMLWDAHLYVVMSGRLSGGRVSNAAVTAGWSVKERPLRAWGEGRSGGGGGFWLREAHSVVFYEVRRLCGGAGII